MKWKHYGWYKSYGFQGRLFKKTSENSFEFSLAIDHPDWQTFDRGLELKVEVKKEYLLWSITTLVGNVGGQLGLFLGFSFAGFMAWLLNLAPKLLNLIKNKVSEIPDSVN